MGGGRRSATLLGIVLAACQAPAPRVLLFQATHEGLEDLYQFDLVSGESSRLTTGSREFANSFPAGSPSGGRVAFVRQRRAAPDSLFVLTLATGFVRSVPTSGLSTVGPPAWSPDGRRILFPSGSGPMSDRLFIADLEGDGLLEVRTPDGVFDCATFSPRGERIVASRQLGDLSQVVTLDPAGGELEIVLSSGSVHYHCPEWSWATDEIGVTSYTRDYGMAEIGVVEAVTEAFRPLVPGPEYQNAMKWSPDGTQIAFQCTDGTPTEPGFYDAMEICVMEVSAAG